MAEIHIVADEGCCLTPQSLRLLNRAIACEEGVSFDMAYGVPPLFVSAEGAGMNIIVNPGSAFIEGDTFSGEGMYFVSNDSEVVLTVGAADPADPRCDLVVAQVGESGENCWQLAIVEGTPAPQPVCPEVPGSSIVLAEITVPAAATAIVAGDIDDVRATYRTCTGEGVWRAYTPTFNTGSVDTVFGRWTRTGNTVFVRVQAHITSMPGPFTCTVPVLGSSASGWTAGWLVNLGNAVARRDPSTGSNVFLGMVLNEGSGQIDDVTVCATDNAEGNQWTAESPFNWTDGATIGLDFWYEAEPL